MSTEDHGQQVKISKRTFPSQTKANEFMQKYCVAALKAKAWLGALQNRDAYFCFVPPSMDHAKVTEDDVLCVDYLISYTILNEEMKVVYKKAILQLLRHWASHGAPLASTLGLKPPNYVDFDFSREGQFVTRSTRLELRVHLYCDFIDEEDV
jgi:hypothetical protein